MRVDGRGEWVGFERGCSDSEDMGWLLYCRKKGSS
nr:MAG TPA: hypothetical protein [Caudoviricetes sp.]